jgi:acetolactate synthase I/II/III large subunit
MVRLTGGQALVQSLLREGVDTIFGIPGIQLDWAYDALHAASDKIRVIHTRHEQATAYMADGYARSTGKVGIYLVVPGPGVLNTTGALSTAYACNSRVLCLTGQIQSDALEVGRGLLHEIPDQIGLLRHLTKWAGSALAPAEVPYLVHEAFRQMRSGRPRPTAIEIPPDVLAAQREVQLLDPFPPAVETGESALLEQAAAILRKAKRPVIISGGGTLLAEAWDELRLLADLLDAPVAMTANGLGAVPSSHRLGFPFTALPSLLADADAVLAVGTRLVGSRNRTVAPPPGVPLIRIDADGTQMYRTTPATVGIVADAQPALAALVELVQAENPTRPDRSGDLAHIKRQLAEDIGSLEPQAHYGRVLREELPDDAIFVTESTQVGYWMSFGGLAVEQPRTFIGSGYQGTLGNGFPTALGAQVGNPGKRVVSVNGDGGFMFNVQELATAVQHEIPLITVVFDDGAYGNVRRIQEHQFGGRTIASELKNPSFAALGEVFGVQGLRAVGPDELRAALRQALAHKGPSLIEVPVGKMPMIFAHMEARAAARR